MLLKRLLLIALMAVSLKFVLAPPAHAYLDPGSGSFIVQMIVAGLMGSLFMLKLYWKKVKEFFTDSKHRQG